MSTLEKLSKQDGLTNLINRKQLETELSKEFFRAQRYHTDMSFAMFDLDHFKKVNDTYGHPAGDEVLKRMALVSLNTMRITDVVGRYGGEEFSIILPGVDVQHAEAALERLRSVIADNPIQFEDQQISITISIGVTQLHPGIKDYQTLIAEADKALYQSKHNGRNRVTVFKPET